MIWMFIGIAVTLAIIACGCYMVYSAFTEKGIPDPGKDALLQVRIQYKLRGIIGGVIILIGIMFAYRIIDSF